MIALPEDAWDDEPKKVPSFETSVDL